MIRSTTGRSNLLILLVALLAVSLFTGCLPAGEQNTSQLPKQEGDPRIASNVQQVARIDGMTPEQNAVLAHGVYEGIIDKIDPTWTDRSDVNNELFVTDLLIKVTKTHKGEKLDGKVVLVRAKHTHKNKKFEDVTQLKFDSPVLVHVINDADKFVTTTGEFSSTYALNLMINEGTPSATYKQSLEAIASVNKLSETQREELVKELSIKPELLTAILKVQGS